MKTYPIKFKPILKERIWGGNKLSTVLGKHPSSKNIGESWEISNVEGNVSQVSNGVYIDLTLRDLIGKFGPELLGSDNFKTFGHDFPLLIKYLDANTDLSVQVHPDNQMAKTYHNSFGKTEMWYIMESNDNSEIILGLKDKTINPQILNAINAQNVNAIFNKEKVKKGDSYFIPAGKVHAIGAGILAAEIQQTSDITYRVYDWDRVDDLGNKRELHNEFAAKATKHFDTNGKAQYKLTRNNKSNLVNCDYFTTNILDIHQHQAKDYTHLDSFVIFMCVEGEVDVTAGFYTETLTMGDTILLPAITEEIAFNSTNAKLLEIYIEKPVAKSVQIAS